VAFKDQIEQPDTHRFPTPSGKIEIFSQQFAEMKNAEIPPIPMYIAPTKEQQNTASENYPIQLISPHSRARANSQFDNIESIKKLGDDCLWINSQDAVKRGIQDGDSVEVHSRQGRIRVTAKVTSRIMPGVASLDQGQWYTPDDSGIDTGGCANVLINDTMSPAGAFACNTCLVQIDTCID
jgi:anaerobic dimethyl sulfoxide reductase subunit A